MAARAIAGPARVAVVRDAVVPAVAVLPVERVRAAHNRHSRGTARSRVLRIDRVASKLIYTRTYSRVTYLNPLRPHTHAWPHVSEPAYSRYAAFSCATLCRRRSRSFRPNHPSRILKCQSVLPACRTGSSRQICSVTGAR